MEKEISQTLMNIPFHLPTLVLLATQHHVMIIEEKKDDDENRTLKDKLTDYACSTHLFSMYLIYSESVVLLKSNNMKPYL